MLEILKFGFIMIVCFWGMAGMFLLLLLSCFSIIRSDQLEPFIEEWARMIATICQSIDPSFPNLESEDEQDRKNYETTDDLLLELGYQRLERPAKFDAEGKFMEN